MGWTVPIRRGVSCNEGIRARKQRMQDVCTRKVPEKTRLLRSHLGSGGDELRLSAVGLAEELVRRALHNTTSDRQVAAHSGEV